jgi:hypothetical protein
MMMMMISHQMRHGMDTSQCPMIGQTRTMQMTENVRLETYYRSQRHGNTVLHISGLVRGLTARACVACCEILVVYVCATFWQNAIAILFSSAESKFVRVKFEETENRIPRRILFSDVSAQQDLCWAEESGGQTNPCYSINARGESASLSHLQ